MKKQQIHLDDIQRILFGEAPPMFLLEVFIRTIIVYIFLLFIVRWLGKRMSGQLTIMEMAVMLTLGAIVSVGMQVPDRGITLSMVVLVCILAFERGITLLEFKYSKFEQLTQGHINLLVKDGVLQLKEMQRCSISHQQLFAQLRSGKIYNLGNVKRVYLEACGIFSIFPDKNGKPGLPVLPPDDKMIISNNQINLFACINCGYVKQEDKSASICTDCGHNEWTKAIF